MAQQRRRLRDHLKHLLVQLAIALPAFILISQPWMANMPILREKEDGVMDLLMAAFQASAPPPNAIPLAFIDIDERTYRIWDEPLLVPREKLLKLIRFATNAKPRLVYVDVELSKGSCNPAEDADLASFVGGYQDETLPPLILPRGVIPPLEDGDAPSFRPSFLDKAYQNGSRALRASALFDVDDNDGVLRRWRLFEKIGPDTEGILPSVQLMAYALLHSKTGSPREISERVRDSLSKGLVPAELDDLNLDLAKQDALSQRIVYTLGTDIPAWRSPPTVERADGVSVPLLERIAASCITDPKENSECIRSYPTGQIERQQENWLRDRIVVIGASHAASRDLFSTPLGSMPGVMVILNAFMTLDQQGILTRPPTRFGLLIETFVVILGYALHFRFAPKTNIFLFMAGISILLMPLCYFFLKYGMWVALAIPLFLSSISETVEQIYSRFKRRTLFSKMR